jgi:uncharacterized protein (UPF0548 family)
MRDDVRMVVRTLTEAEVARLRSAPFTYAPVGDQAPVAPPGFHTFTRTARLNRRDFDGAADDLLMWRMHERSGLRVWASDVPLLADTVAVMRLGVGRVGLRIPCRVIYVVDEPDRRGFAYGTLPGHPEAGEERFMLRRRSDGGIELTVSAFSRPASRLAKLGGPIGRRVQDIMTQRYLQALDRSP